MKLSAMIDHLAGTLDGAIYFKLPYATRYISIGRKTGRVNYYSGKVFRVAVIGVYFFWL